MMAGDELIYPTSRMLKGFYRSGIEIVLVTTKRLLKEERKLPGRGFPLTASVTTIWFRPKAWSIWLDGSKTTSGKIFCHGDLRWQQANQHGESPPAQASYLPKFNDENDSGRWPKF
ncbi:hypothetical protein [Klebsiella pneumoniae]|uniref:hypothetical protein n=1 Tax=Klebsiella pneumoniae TaxID=573 RepID=UPI00296EF9BF|nr:hypothetical protein [Klebsiella pneumoniae]